MNKIISGAVREYEKELKRIAKKKEVRLDRDELETVCLKISNACFDRIKRLDMSYRGQCSMELKVDLALLAVDQKYFGKQNGHGAWHYDFVNGNENWKKLTLHRKGIK